MQAVQPWRPAAPPVPAAVTGAGAVAGAGSGADVGAAAMAQVVVLLALVAVAVVGATGAGAGAGGGGGGATTTGSWRRSRFRRFDLGWFRLRRGTGWPPQRLSVVQPWRAARGEGGAGGAWLLPWPACASAIVVALERQRLFKILFGLSSCAARDCSSLSALVAATFDSVLACLPRSPLRQLQLVAAGGVGASVGNCAGHATAGARRRAISGYVRHGIGDALT